MDPQIGEETTPIDQRETNEPNQNGHHISDQNHPEPDDENDETEKIKEMETSQNLLRERAATRIQRQVRIWIRQKNTLSPDQKNVQNEFEILAKTLLNRKRVAEELLQTEQVYVQSLNTIVTYFMKPLKQQQPLLAEKYVKIVFGNIEDIQIINSEILNKFQKVMQNWQPDQPLMNVFLKMLDFLKLYTVYCSTHYQAIDILSKRDKQLTPFLRKCQTDNALSMDLSSYLIMPVQRIPRYKMLFEQLLKYTPPTHEDYPFIKAAVDKVSAVAVQVNEGVREKETQTFLEEMEKKFVGNVPKLVKPGRKLVKEGNLVKICRKEKKRKYFWLFNDLLIYGLRMDSNRFLFHNSVVLEKTRCFSLDDTKEYSNALQVLSKEKSFIAYADTAQSRDEWMAAIQQAIADPTGRFVKLNTEEEEVNEIAPVWMPDSTANNCLLCNTTFTVFRRRHHCRRCGKLVCGNCSAHSWKLENIGKQCRVCDECFDNLLKTTNPASNDSDVESTESVTSSVSSPSSLTNSTSSLSSVGSSGNLIGGGVGGVGGAAPPLPPKPAYLRNNLKTSGSLIGIGNHNPPTGHSASEIPSEPPPVPLRSATLSTIPSGDSTNDGSSSSESSSSTVERSMTTGTTFNPLSSLLSEMHEYHSAHPELRPPSIVSAVSPLQDSNLEDPPTPTPSTDHNHNYHPGHSSHPNNYNNTPTLNHSSGNLPPRPPKRALPPLPPGMQFRAPSPTNPRSPTSSGVTSPVVSPRQEHHQPSIPTTTEQPTVMSPTTSSTAGAVVGGKKVPTQPKPLKSSTATAGLEFPPPQRKPLTDPVATIRTQKPSPPPPASYTTPTSSPAPNPAPTPTTTSAGSVGSGPSSSGVNVFGQRAPPPRPPPPANYSSR